MSHSPNDGPNTNALVIALVALTNLMAMAGLAPRVGLAALFILTSAVVSIVALIVSGSYAARLVRGSTSMSVCVSPKLPNPQNMSDVSERDAERGGRGRRASFGPGA